MGTRYRALTRGRWLRNSSGNRGTFIHGIVGEAEVPHARKFDIGLAIGVLHHLEERDAESLFKKAREHLVPGGPSGDDRWLL
jgi:hypothetical protein